MQYFLFPSKYLIAFDIIVFQVSLDIQNKVTLQQIIVLLEILAYTAL